MEGSISDKTRPSSNLNLRPTGKTLKTPRSGRRLNPIKMLIALIPTRVSGGGKSLLSALKSQKPIIMLLKVPAVVKIP